MDDAQNLAASLQQQLTDAQESYRALTSAYHRQREQFAQAVGDNLKRKEIVDFALTERIEHLLRLCDGHVRRNSDLDKRLRQKEDCITDLEKRLVVEGSNHAVCVNERNTLRARVAEMESVEARLKAKLAEITEDRDQVYRISYARANTINAAIAALQS